jgi:hypothetical protein
MKYEVWYRDTKYPLHNFMVVVRAKKPSHAFKKVLGVGYKPYRIRRVK